MSPPADVDEDAGDDVVDGAVVDAVAKQLVSELEETLAKPPAEGEKPLPTTWISSVDPAGKSGFQTNQVS